MERLPKAFISCSVRDNDASFVEMIERVVRSFKFIPDFTVGRYTNSPESVTETMRKGIEKADCLIAIITPRYKQIDINNPQRSFEGPSEMIHAEIAAANQLKKPIIAFVKEGTDPGGYLPALTQYFVIKKNHGYQDIIKMLTVRSMFQNTRRILKQKWANEESLLRNESWGDLFKGIGVAATIIGGISLLFSGSDKTDENKS
ncbi:toll/interleukin-1 receptor domain-containing protein [Marinifilum fragile]|uniref:toll/interleukin-1 receptor domain-containing protein n=1 Tax=Marinifilum fragile TaxID=570161 RepID=UPI0006D24D74|nr:toll/interleukin-1 receptor domain-containing protein [Marinifilum fragile]